MPPGPGSKVIWRTMCVPMCGVARAPDLSTYHEWVDGNGYTHQSINEETWAQERAGRLHHAHCRLEIVRASWSIIEFHLDTQGPVNQFDVSCRACVRAHQSLLRSICALIIVVKQDAQQSALLIRSGAVWPSLSWA